MFNQPVSLSLKCLWTYLTPGVFTCKSLKNPQTQYQDLKINFLLIHFVISRPHVFMFLTLTCQTESGFYSFLTGRLTPGLNCVEFYFVLCVFECAEQ